MLTCGRFLIRYGDASTHFDVPRRVASKFKLGRKRHKGGLTMKRLQIVGLFIGALLLTGYEPVAAAMPVSAPGIAARFIESDGLVVKVQTAGQARRVSRRTARRTSRRQ